MKRRMMKMFKKIGLPVMAFVGLLALAPLHQAKAAVRFGVSVGAPVYAAPVYRPYPIVAPPAYVCPPPVVRAPAYAYHAWAGRDVRHWDRDHDFRDRGRR